jgi:hypothetical protein
MLSGAVTERSESRGGIEASLSTQPAFGANRHSFNDVPAKIREDISVEFVGRALARERKVFYYR